ncbi:MAG TPA: NfeD family protein [Pseudobacteroides sp.]|uniref:NfeD family protein n=1 Tax=Pseudobacteroides sp. TaxID=1968840 RepID=UPI002F92D66D
MDKIPLPVLWLIIAVVLGVIEASSLNLITLWFAIGAVAAMISALFGIPFIYQVVIFVIVSALMLYFTKPLIKKFLYVRKEKTNADRIIGDKGIVVEKIDPVNSTGQVKIRGQIWTARSTDDKIIELDELVEVQEISGVKLFVKKSSDINKNEKQ